MRVQGQGQVEGVQERGVVEEQVVRFRGRFRCGSPGGGGSREGLGHRWCGVVGSCRVPCAWMDDLALLFQSGLGPSPGSMGDAFCEVAMGNARRWQLSLLIFRVFAALRMCSCGASLFCIRRVMSKRYCTVGISGSESEGRG